MKKTFFAFFLFLAGISNQASAQQYDIRNVSWGMSHAEVRRAEGIRPFEEDEAGAIYRVKFLDQNVLITYYFIEDKAVAAAYVFLMNKKDEKLSSQRIERFMAGFGKIESMMTKKYGESLPGENIIWTNLEAKDKKTDLKEALLKGYVKFITSWDTRNTDIKLGLQCGHEGSILGAMYVSKSHHDLIKKDAKLKEKLAIDSL